MPRIRCHYIECIFLDDGYCGAAAIEVDPDVGCMTYSRSDDIETETEWEDAEEEDADEWEDLDEEEEEEMWLEEDEF